MRKALLLLALLAASGLATWLHAATEARRDPVVRTATLELPGWPAGANPVRAVLISDVHVGSPAMDAVRLEHIVRRIDALHPDIVLIAGDMIFGHDPRGAARLGEAMVAPLSHLSAPLGVVAVLGNHDHWTGADAVRTQLRRARVTVLENEAAVRGPLAIGGVDDAYTRHDDLPAALAALRRLRGGRVLLSHSPDLAPAMPEGAVLLAGHTHCGQVVLPLYGALASVSDYGERYRCGVVRERGGTTVVTAGLGTSGPPVRLGAPPDLWLLSFGPAPPKRDAARSQTHP